MSEEDKNEYSGPPISYRAEGDRYLQKQEYLKAITYYTKSVEDNEAGDNNALIKRSKCQERLGKIDESLNDVNKVLIEKPKNVKALLQKAESLYSNGEFEMALVLYHRGNHIKPSMKEFTLGIHRCLESINNTCGDKESPNIFDEFVDSKAYLTLSGDLTFFEKNIEAEKAARNAALSKYKDGVGGGSLRGRAKEKEVVKEIPEFLNTVRVRALLGLLYGDRDYLDRMLHTIDRDTNYGKDVFDDAYEAAVYLDQQVELWRTEHITQARIPGTKPRSVKELKEKANQMVVDELQKIARDQANCRYQQSLERAKALLECVEEYRDGFIHGREEVYCKLQSFIGNAYLELDDPVSALDHFKMQKSLADQYHLPDLKSEALDNIGRTYAKMGEFKKALNIWHVRLPLVKTDLDKACLYHEMGRCHYKLENYKRSRDLGDKSMTSATQADDIMWKLSASVLMAQSLSKSGQFRKSLNAFLEAKSLAEIGEYKKTHKAILYMIQCLEDKLRDIKDEVDDGGELVDFRDTGVQTEEEGLTEEERAARESAALMDEALEHAKEHIKKKRGGYRADQAYVTLATNDIYAMGALVLAASLLQSETDRTLVVMVTPGLSQPMMDLLNVVFDLVFDVSIIDSRDYDNLALLERAELGITFTKIHCWRLIQFEKGVFMDADTLVLQNVDDLFNRQELSAAPDAGWPDCFNSGVFVFKPSMDTFYALLEFAQQFGSFDGGDQGLLNQYFDGWATEDIDKHLPFTYNLVSQAFYSYLPAYKAFGHQAKIVHFIGPDKPWSIPYDGVACRPEFRIPTIQSQELIQIWWDFFMKYVQPLLSDDMQGLAGQLSRMNIRVVVTSEEEHMDTLRLQSWERNEIDYMGKDAFANIKKRLDEKLGSEDRTPSPQHAGGGGDAEYHHGGDDDDDTSQDDTTTTTTTSATTEDNQDAEGDGQGDGHENRDGHGDGGDGGADGDESAQDDESDVTSDVSDDVTEDVTESSKPSDFEGVGQAEAPDPHAHDPQAHDPSDLPLPHLGEDGIIEDPLEESGQSGDESNQTGDTTEEDG